MRIVGFAQLHNEMEKGNLENWLQCMQSICDTIYIYEQASDDGSIEYYKNFDNLNIIYSEVNDFYNEQLCKNKLLDLIKQNETDGTWIFWMDGDTLIEKKATREYVENMLNKYKQYGCVRLKHYNLWRSDTFYRTDDGFHNLNDKGVPAFWKLNRKLNFAGGPGFHNGNVPVGITDPPVSDPLILIHRGFATDFQIMKRYDIYYSRGERGRKIERILNEHTLAVQQLDPNILPDGVPKELTDPRNLPKIREVYNKWDKKWKP